MLELDWTVVLTQNCRIGRDIDDTDPDDDGE